jgi:hypothetical protein
MSWGPWVAGRGGCSFQTIANVQPPFPSRSSVQRDPPAAARPWRAPRVRSAACARLRGIAPPHIWCSAAKLRGRRRGAPRNSDPVPPANPKSSRPKYQTSVPALRRSRPLTPAPAPPLTPAPAPTLTPAPAPAHKTRTSAQQSAFAKVQLSPSILQTSATCDECSDVPVPVGPSGDVEFHLVGGGAGAGQARARRGRLRARGSACGFPLGRGVLHGSAGGSVAAR